MQKSQIYGQIINRSLRGGAAFAVLLFTIPSLGAPNGMEDLRSALERFHDHPQTFMNEIPKKYSADLEREVEVESVFSAMSIQNREYVLIKDQLRLDRTIIPSTPSFLSEIAPADRPEDLVEGNPDKIIFSLETMEEQNLREARVATQPWSDDYWPIYKGILGNRYADDDFGGIYSWKEAFDYVQGAPASDIWKSQEAKKIDLLSPGEKYDLLLGEDHWSITQYGWAEGKLYFDRYGEVEKWMGVCHGWAPAAYMLERPLRKILVKSADDKTELTFYPADIKALATTLWANGRSQSYFIGGRCRDKEPKQNENGRVLEADCFDTNPGTWHVTVVNQLGRLGRSFVMDATFDYEVWNQPVLNYSYQYFNPETAEDTDDLAKAMIDIGEYSKDPFKEFRSTKAKKIVGVSMLVTYLVENHPQQLDEDDPRYDVRRTVRYLYDLEIDSKGEIIGGEWYQNAHPDFLWTPPFESRAISIGDYFLLGENNWDGRQALSEKWKSNGIKAARRGQPLSKLVESLIQLSRQQ